MKAVYLTRKDKTVSQEIRDVDIPQPKDDEVLIQVAYSGTNPKDWKYISPTDGSNSGDDIAGVVHSAGKNAKGFHKGDRVAAYHVIGAPDGSFAEYAIAPASTTFHIPDSVPFESAATIPLAALTAGVGLNRRLGLPSPWQPATEKIPLIVYGGSSSVGLFALKLAKLSNIGPIVAIAGGGADVIREHNLADAVVDYRNNPDLAASITEAFKGAVPKYAFDAISEHGSTAAVSKAMKEGGQIAHVIPVKQEEVSNGVQLRHTYVGNVHKYYEGISVKEQVEKDKEYGYVLSKWFTFGLQSGEFKGHPYEIVDGLQGVSGALQQLLEGKVSGKKMVIKIADL